MARTPVTVKSELTREVGVPDDSFPISGSDTVDLTPAIRAIRATVGGTIKVDLAGGQTRTIAITDGETRYLKINRVWSTGTTATGLEGMP